MMRAGLVVLLLGGLPAPAAAQDATAPPAGAMRVLEVAAAGVQVYMCTASGWVLTGPEATLSEAGVLIGSHSVGPRWMLTDGSSVTGEAIASAPQPDGVPWLLLRARMHDGAGRLADVTLIRRTDTQGGRAPAGACTPGDMVRVPYRATYQFFTGG